ncbi:MAG TPA: HYR domain-containing protein, partial [Bacteroidia bacterium]|nr:HYR domain-containing protein [Bacteroidia bacterium]
IGAAQSGTGSLSVVLTATNTASQTATCIFTVTKTDNLAPTITCPSNISSNTDPGVCSATVSFTNPSGADNCSGSTTTQIAGLASGSTFPAGNTTNTFRVTDASGNTATCSFTVDVTDNELPTIVCPPNLVISTAANSCDAIVNYTMPTGADNCGISQVTLGIGLASGSAFPLGTTNTTLIASDLGSNVSSCNFSVLVVDSVAPTAVCQNLTLTLDANGAATLLPSAIGGGSSDNCFLTGLALSVTSFTCTDIGSNLVVLTATDSAGNTSTCSAQVLVSDVTSPNVICQNDTLYLDQQGNAMVNLAALDGGSTDNCGIASLQASPNSFTTNNVGSNNVTVTFTDLGGNTTTCVSVVEVIDTFITAIGLPVGNGIQLIAAPNPAFDRLQVQVRCTACLPGDALQLELWGMTGQRLQTQELAGGLQNQEIELNLSGLPAGNYLLGLRHNNGFISQKILKY